jgi:hypothetical protein
MIPLAEANVTLLAIAIDTNKAVSYIIIIK